MLAKLILLDSNNLLDINIKVVLGSFLGLCTVLFAHMLLNNKSNRYIFYILFSGIVIFASSLLFVSTLFKLINTSSFVTILL